jgi:transposase-like protein
MDSQVFSPLKKNETRFGTPKIKGRLHFDEKYINVKGTYCYDVNVIDNKTKFIPSELFVHERSLEKCKVLLKRVKTWCYEQIMQQYHQKKKRINFVADKFSNYYIAWKRLFSRITEMTAGIPIACKRYGLKHNNNTIERYNRELGRRMDAIDVFQSFEGAKEFFGLRNIIYNYINPHTSLKGRTPAEAAGIKMSLGQNKLLNLIKYAKRLEMTLN